MCFTKSGYSTVVCSSSLLCLATVSCLASFFTSNNWRLKFIFVYPWSKVILKTENEIVVDDPRCALCTRVGSLMYDCITAFECLFQSERWGICYWFTQVAKQLVDYLERDCPQKCRRRNLTLNSNIGLIPVTVILRLKVSGRLDTMLHISHLLFGYKM